MATQSQSWTIEQLMQMRLGFAPARILGTALDLDLFAKIAAGNTTAAAIASAAESTERGTRMVLDPKNGSSPGRQFPLTSFGKYRIQVSVQLLRRSPIW
jgi:hypothetical protein